jgi:poly(A) polymerase
LRAGYDFLLLRCAAGECPTELGDWWTAFIDGSTEQREELLSGGGVVASTAATSGAPGAAGASTGGPRRRRRRGKPRTDGEPAKSAT